MSEIRVVEIGAGTGVVYLPGRKYPAAIIQADALHSISIKLEAIAQKTNDDGVRDELIEITQEIDEYLSYLSAVSARNNMELPF